MPHGPCRSRFCFLSEKVTQGRVGSVIGGFIGVLIILRPGLSAFNPAALLVLVAAFGYATTNIVTKKLTTTETAFAIVFWMNLVQLPLGFYLWQRSAVLSESLYGHLIPMLGIGIAGLSAHFCLTSALKVADATVVIPLDFMRLPLIAIVGWTFYGEQLDVFVFAGAAIIIAGVLWALNTEAKTAKASEVERQKATTRRDDSSRLAAPHLGHRLMADKRLERADGRKRRCRLSSSADNEPPA